MTSSFVAFVIFFDLRHLHNIPLAFTENRSWSALGLSPLSDRSAAFNQEFGTRCFVLGLSRAPRYLKAATSRTHSKTCC